MMGYILEIKHGVVDLRLFKYELKFEELLISR